MIYIYKQETFVIIYKGNKVFGLWITLCCAPGNLQGVHLSVTGSGQSSSKFHLKKDVPHKVLYISNMGHLQNYSETNLIFQVRNATKLPYNRSDRVEMTESN